MEHIFVIVSILFWILSLALCFRLHVKLHLKEMDKRDILDVYEKKFKPGKDLQSKINFVRWYILLFTNDDMAGYVDDLDLDDKQRADLHEITGDKTWINDTHKVTFRDQINNFIAAMASTLSVEGKVADNLTILSICNSVIMVLLAPIVLFGKITASEQGVYNIGIGCADISIAAVLILIALTYKRIGDKIKQLNSMSKPLFMANYFDIPEVKDFAFGLAATTQFFGKPDISKNLPKATADLNRRLHYADLLVYLTITAENVRLANAEVHDLHTLSNATLFTQNLDMDHKRAFITLINSLKDRELISTLSSDNTNGKSRDNLMLMLNDNLDQAIDVFVTHLKQVLSDYRDIRQQIVNGLPSSQKQKELIDYYVNFDKAGKMLTTGDMSLLDLNLKGGSKHD